MNIFTVMSILSLANISAFHIIAKVDQSLPSKGVRIVRMIESDEVINHCYQLLKSLIAAEKQSTVSSHTIVLAQKCSKIQAVRATIQKLILKNRNKYSLWW